MSENRKKYVLPLSPEYVSHWGLWEGIREIYQNALDEVETPSQARIIYMLAEGVLRIDTPTGKLTPDTLVLGKTSKRNKQQTRGKFGEGYKLALLVLARLGHRVTIRTNDQVWTPQLEHDKTFDADVLSIYVDELVTGLDGVQFTIHGITAEQWAAIQRNIRSEVIDTILTEPAEKGRIYVGGLYVATNKNFHCGYSFGPGRIKLNRDRDMVSDFDLAWETSRLWTDTTSDRCIELLEAEAPDVEYVEQHASAHSPATTHYSGYFYERHGATAVPVSNQEEIQRATAAGMKWVLVPEKVKSVLRLVRSWFIPTTASPVEQLKAFRKKYHYSMNSTMLCELDEIIEVMEPSSKTEAVA